ncbi:MAG: hypothetical protein A2020_02215 [Lentisphaerae bacterium GWF2_45_14]|nr:MAG: hypothetical protein A2020_02215 [Lentisphaerae bacterium GWF2_45_14]
MTIKRILHIGIWILVGIILGLILVAGVNLILRSKRPNKFLADADTKCVVMNDNKIVVLVADVCNKAPRIGAILVIDNKMNKIASCEIPSSILSSKTFSFVTNRTRDKALVYGYEKKPWVLWDDSISKFTIGNGDLPIEKPCFLMYAVRP